MIYTVYFGATYFKSAISVKTITNMPENKEKKITFYVMEFRPHPLQSSHFYRIRPYYLHIITLISS